MDGTAPAGKRTVGLADQSRGRRRPPGTTGAAIGWTEDDALYLEPESSFAEAQDLARVQGDGLPIGSRTLYRRMKEKGLLASWDERRSETRSAARWKESRTAK